MALIKCGECGTDISSDAKVCPNCGNKKIQSDLFKKWKKDNPTKFKLIIASVVLFLIVMVVGNAFKPSDCDCNKLMNQYGILKKNNQYVPEEFKDDHMYCVKNHFHPPMNEDGSSPCE